MTDVLVNVTVLTAIIGGTVAVLKTAGFPSRFAGVLALGLGVGGGALAAASGAIDLTAAQGAWTGAIAGLTAAGAYSATSAATGGSQPPS